MPKWYVYIYDEEKNEMREYDIFTHFEFVKAIREFYKENPRPLRKDLDQAVRFALMEHFWDKEKWEIYLFPLYIKDRKAVRKIDVFSQVAMNFTPFVNYIIKHREEIEKMRSVKK